MSHTNGVEEAHIQRHWLRERDVARLSEAVCAIDRASGIARAVDVVGGAHTTLVSGGILAWGVGFGVLVGWGLGSG